jgi:lipopolysaccharide export LptBFGC system permease protein LptF
VADDAPERPPTAQFMAALSVTRNAKIGLATGVAFALLAYVYRVFELGGPAADTRGSPLLFLVLAVTLAFATAALVTVVLTLVSAYRLAHER